MRTPLPSLLVGPWPHTLPAERARILHLLADALKERTLELAESVIRERFMALAARTIKRVTLELGGKSPSLILPDADLDLVIDSVLFRAFFHTGQCCEIWYPLF